MATKKKSSGESAPKIKFEFSLYVAGPNPQSVKAVTNIKKILDEFPGQYQLKVINIYEQPQLAREDQVIAAPTLIKKLPKPIRKFIGDLSNEQKIRMHLS
jgi:circadian clock protein KaiB